MHCAAASTIAGMTLPPDIQQFFEAYARAFNALDGEAVARLYALPSAIVDAQSHTHWPTFEPIRDNMVALCRLYRDDGFVRTHFEPTAFIAQGAHFAVADVRWTIELDGARAPRIFNTTYNLKRLGDVWRVLLCTAYSEPRLS